MTDSGTRREIAFVEGIPEVALSFEVPGSWSPEPGGGTVALAALSPKEVSGPFMDNVVVTIERLDEGMPTALELVHGAMRLWMNGVVQDLHVIDERALPFVGRDGMFLAYLQTTEQHVSVITRQCITVVADVVVGVSLTSFPFRDAEAEELFEDVLASCALTTTEEAGR